MKHIGQLTEQELKEYNSGNKDIVKKYLKEGSTNYKKWDVDIINEVRNRFDFDKMPNITGTEQKIIDIILELSDKVEDIKRHPEVKKMIKMNDMAHQMINNLYQSGDVTTKMKANTLNVKLQDAIGEWGEIIRY